MDLNIYKPQNRLLQDHIDCFYTFKRDSKDKDISYVGLPSNTVFLTLSFNAELLINKGEITTLYSKNAEVKSLLIIDNQQQGLTNYKGMTDEICIYFKPLGISAFIEKPLSTFISNTVSDFYPNEKYIYFLNQLSKLKEDKERIALLENYLVSVFRQFQHPFLWEVMEIIKANNQVSVEELSKISKVSRATLHKQFMRHIGTTPSQFIKIHRFREALKIFNKNSTREQLIDIAFLVNYFDQSHMAKDFKALTGFSPKVFFSKLSQLGNKQVSWIFL